MKDAPLSAPPGQSTPEPSPTPTPTPAPTPDNTGQDGEDEDNGDYDGEDEDTDTGNDDGDSDSDQIDEGPDILAPSVPPQGNNINPALPLIALSFDDGPGIYTEQLLDLLERYNVKATFSVIGTLVDTKPETLIRAVSIGCEVIGHSWDHKNMAKLSADDVRKQITDTSDALEAVTGTAVSIFRPPYGEVSVTMREVSESLGFSIINWSVDTQDWHIDNPETIFYAVLQRVKDGSIILSHDIHESTLEAYKMLIPELLLQGYQLVTVSELLLIKYDEMIPGHVYYDAYNGS